MSDGVFGGDDPWDDVDDEFDGDDLFDDYGFDDDDDDDDEFDDDDDDEEDHPVKKETDLVKSPSDTPEGVTVSFKGGPGYEASLLVLRAPDIRGMYELLSGDADVLQRLLRRMAKIQEYSTRINTRVSKPKAEQNVQTAVFHDGKMLVSEEGQDAESGEHRGVTTCPHGRTYVARNGWEAYFCNSDTRKCQTSFLNRKTGVFELAMK